MALWSAIGKAFGFAPKSHSKNIHKNALDAHGTRDPIHRAAAQERLKSEFPGGPAGFERIMRVFTDGLADPSKRQGAIVALAGFGEMAIPFLTPLLSSKDPKVATIAHSLICNIQKEQQLLIGNSTAEPVPSVIVDHSSFPLGLAQFLEARLSSDEKMKFVQHWKLLPEIDAREALIEVMVGRWVDGPESFRDVMLILTGFCILLLAGEDSSAAKIAGTDIRFVVVVTSNTIEIHLATNGESQQPTSLRVSNVNESSANRFIAITNLMVTGGYWGRPAELVAKINEINAPGGIQ